MRQIGQALQRSPMNSSLQTQRPPPPGQQIPPRRGQRIRPLPPPHHRRTRGKTSIRTRFDLLALAQPAFARASISSSLSTVTWRRRRGRVRRDGASLDDRLASVAGKAKSALTRYGFEVLIAGGNLTAAQKAEAQRHKAALEYFLHSLHRHQCRARERDPAGFPCSCARWLTPSASATACTRSSGNHARAAR